MESTRSLSSAPPSTAQCEGAKAAPRKANYPQLYLYLSISPEASLLAEAVENVGRNRPVERATPVLPEAFRGLALKN